MIKLVYSPFCTPTVPPLSLANLKSLMPKAECIDLNAKFHRLKFSKLDLKELRACYELNNKKVLNNKDPEYFDELLNMLLKDDPHTVIFSFVYNSQCFYGLRLVQELKKKGIRIIVGGPAVSHKIYEAADRFCKDYVELMDHLGKEYQEPMPDYSDFDYKDYFVDDITLSFKTCSSCYYKQCAFCTHHQGSSYEEYSIENLKKSIVKNKAKNIFLVDDMIEPKRLMKIAEMMKELDVKWMCQLRPKGFDLSSLNRLHECGLRAVMWGIESGNQQVLDLMQKGTGVDEIKQVLNDSHKNGIVNIAFIMFGFPGETKEQAYDTIRFLEECKEYLDLVQTSTFGLQPGSKVYENPEKYGIEIIEEKRTILDQKVSYKVKSGMQWQEADTFRKKHKKFIASLCKLPQDLIIFKERILNQKLFKMTKN